MIDILEKAKSGAELTREDALALLAIETGSEPYYTLLGLANAQARSRFGGRGTIFAQIGIEASPCPANCAFCSLAKDVFVEESRFLLPVEAAEKMTDELLSQKVDELFLMTTANYPQADFLAYAARIKRRLPDGMRFVANVGDFDLSYAKQLKETGFTGVYHIRRLGEGRDTQLDPAGVFERWTRCVTPDWSFTTALSPSARSTPTRKWLMKYFARRNIPLKLWRL